MVDFFETWLESDIREIVSEDTGMVDWLEVEELMEEME